MAADGAGAIGPVSVRYAAQIRELLYAQAAQRMAADQEAARTKVETDRTAQAEAAAKAEQVRQPLAARIATPEPTPLTAPTKLPEPSEARPVTTAPAQLVDIQA